MIIIKQILELCSDPIRQMILEFLNSLRDTAAKTDNPFDDLAVHLLFIILGFPY
ncbi:MAG: hypothetical protein HWN66_16665 [Candidatus Helarchaeota archaeon]|nr:hypothetical protein [Candidatus Helarchaeota archaeon]